MSQLTRYRHLLNKSTTGILAAHLANCVERPTKIHLHDARPNSHIHLGSSKCNLCHFLRYTQSCSRHCPPPRQ
jgi:hypothetical protein